MRTSVQRGIVMIDLKHEHLIELRSVPRHLPKRPSGKRVHISAVYRWISRGVRGITLESIVIGGTRYTSIEALERFSEQLSGPPERNNTPPTTTRRRSREQERAAREAAKILGLGQ